MRLKIIATAMFAASAAALLRRSIAERRRVSDLEASLIEIEAGLRGRTEQLHEIRSTLAGVTSAFRLLDDHTIAASTRARLEHAIGTELERLERLVTPTVPTSPTAVDLDAALEVLALSHRSRGRSLVWESGSGVAVHSRPDDLTEALNILIDNAATHGGSVSRVEVTTSDDHVEIAVSDDGPGVAPTMRDRIFDWGTRGEDSTGDGIGLHLARRLVGAYGGSLTLADVARGSSFIIRLPRA